MSTNRQLYFYNLQRLYLSKYINKNQFFRLLQICNGFKDDTELTLHFDDEMKDEEKFYKYFTDILKGKMFEYVVNEAYFDKKRFYVNENVLIPRQETEELVYYFRECAKEMYDGSQKLKIADICTGSGCIAISIKDYFFCDCEVYASDISSEAIKVARTNDKKFDTVVKFLTGNITDPFVEKGILLDCIVCNPPYISDIAGIDKRTWEQEPHEALLAEPNTYFYEYILSNAHKILKTKHIMAFEIGEDMRKVLPPIAHKYFPNDSLKFIKDMDGKWRFMIMTNDGSINQKPVEALNNHGIIAFPTETVMGLGIAYDDEIAFNLLNALKGRPEGKPYSLMLGNKKEISKYAYVSEIEQKIIDKFLPGPITILLKKKTLPDWVTLGSPYVGIRVPNDRDILGILNDFGKPILAPSANKSGEKPALNSKEVLSIFGRKLNYIVPGSALNGIASTIVKVDNGIEIVRQGEITKEQIEEAIK